MDWEILKIQPELTPYARFIRERMDRLKRKKKELLPRGKKLTDFADGYLYYGLHRTKSGWVYREWAPAAEKLCLTGDFNDWDRESHPLKRLKNGSWEICLRGKNALKHLQRYKVAVTAFGKTEDRIPLYAGFVQKNQWGDYAAVVWAPETEYVWNDGEFSREENVPPLIYEAHVGMATEERRIGTYREFADAVLPRIQRDGYNTVQLMAVMEHPYYGSFGYHVSNFYAPSSWFGTPDDLRYLIDSAHRMGLSVLLDLVHSHAVKNTAEGINRFDGTDGQFFKEGPEGEHKAWGSKVFDYGKNGVLHFLLSNLKYWMEEFHFDGFRFDGAGSMLYRDHGLGVEFLGLPMYFSDNTDDDAVTYLQLASELCHSVKPGSVLIAEDVSAMPGLCLPTEAGGIGFDYRLSMGLPDFYIRMIKERPIGHWEMGKLVWELLGHRTGEKRIAYAESHDQALVGDQTILFRLCGDKMYTQMDRASEDPVVERAVALHKLIRLVTLCAGGEGYLNFMGNEFGHPEWIDFPREENGWSHDYARRQWSLSENGFLRYSQLGDFDREMLRLFSEEKLLNSEARCLKCHETDQILTFERSGYLFAFNFHPTNSQSGLFLPAPALGDYVPVLSTDSRKFGGWENIREDYVYHTWEKDAEGRDGFSVYLPALTAVVLGKKTENGEKENET